jgi:uncharacterized protein with HEPN domain
MRLETKKLLTDIKHAVSEIRAFVGDSDFERYSQNSLVRSAVERQFEIVGEALVRLNKVDSMVAADIGDHRRIIAFRNILVHAYDSVDHRIVWGVIVQELPNLASTVESLLADSD